jgi:hypothetical protein
MRDDAYGAAMNELVFAAGCICAAGSFLMLILISVAGGVFERRIKDEAGRKKAERISLSIAFALFLILGFSMVPVMVGAFTYALPSVIPADVGFITGNDTLIVLAFWAAYLAGLVILLPEAKKEFFAPGE